MTRFTEKTAKEQRGRPFKVGQSGNPSGRPKGSRNKATLAIQAMMDGEGEEITRTAIELAKMGELTAIRLVLERILPPRKDSLISFAMPHIDSVDDIPLAMASLVASVAEGELTPSEAQAISSLLEQTRRAIETCELEQRIQKLEQRS